ncbi:MAG: GNAT family N-acetyltransferase [Wenzhouxiangella sp.]
MALAVERLCGAESEPWLDALAELRIRIFRAWPYLYDGSADYERSYLADYARSPGSVIVLARNGREVVGCATGLPLTDADAAFRQPFVAAGMAVDEIFYFGESVLDTAWRGQGIGHRFFDEREAHARQAGFAVTTFCAVQRPADHPLRPLDYRPLDSFWQKRGYHPGAGLVTRFAWKDIDQPGETDKRMQFWLRGP